MISFSIAPTTLLALCFLLILNTSANDSSLTYPLVGQQGAVGFNLPSVTDDAFALNMNQLVVQDEADLPPLSDGLMKNTKSPPQTDGETVNCAADSPHRHERLSRLSRQLWKRQPNDFCSFPRPPPPSKPGASNIPAGQQDSTGAERLRGSMGGAKWVHSRLKAEQQKLAIWAS